ncbi:MAG: thiamine pyrophosphate-binding protein [Alphaproteobacteria bacterium]
MPVMTVADAIIEALAQAGVRRIFGIPGGGSSLDIIEAGAKRGIDFVLARTETSAALMAAATAEITGIPGVIITGLGPGAANATNGIAYAQLDRAPLLVITDRFDDAESFVSHQAVDHGKLFAEVVKGSRILRAGDGPADVTALLRLALAHPQGAVHIDLSSKQAGAPAGARAARRDAAAGIFSEADSGAARALLVAARKPAILAGLQARHASEPLRALAAELACPVFTTFKAKGAMPDDDALCIGLTTGGTAEAPCLGEADLLILYGFDPVELIPQPWKYRAPIIELGLVRGLPHYRAPDVSLIGPLAAGAAALRGTNRAGGWKMAELAAHKAYLRARIARHVTPGALGAVEIVEAAARAAPPGVRITVDAGAHMFAVMSLWRAGAVNDVIISDGLSTMGLALPAAIGATLETPERPVMCFTGDGGLMMCLGELATAAERGCNIAVVVLNDAALSLIDVKQQKRGLPTRGVRYPRTDFAMLARGMGCRAFTARDAPELEAAIKAGFAAPGPTLIDAHVDPAKYSAQVDALRA